MTALITGGTGFLGQALLAPLAARGEVFAIHRPGTSPPLCDGVTWIAQDLSAPLDADLPASVDTVIHLAQSRRYREFPEAAVELFEVNTGAAVRLLDYARRAGARSFVLASSGAVYPSGPEPLSEDTPPAPSSLYASGKLAADDAARHYAEFFHAQVLRYFFIYGPGQRGMFIPGVIQRVREGVPVTLAGQSGIRVNPVFVSDAADATLAATEREDSGVFNVAGPDVVSLRELATIAGEQLDAAPTFEVTAPGSDLIADTTLMRERLTAPRIGTREGLRRTITADTPAGAIKGG